MKTIVCTLIGVFFLSVSGSAQTVSDVLQQTETKMQKAVGEAAKKLNTVRENRAKPSLLDGITVEYYGSPNPLKNVASIEVSDSQMLTVTPWDKKLSEPIYQALVKSKLKFTTKNDGSIFMIHISLMTEAQKKEQLVLARNIAEQGRVSIRYSKREAVDTLKAKGYGASDYKVYQLESKYIAKIDDLLKQKERGILEF